MQAIIKYVRFAYFPSSGPPYLGSYLATNFFKEFSKAVRGYGKVSWHGVGILSTSHMRIRGMGVPQPLVYFELITKSGSFPLTDICTKSPKNHTGFCSSDSNLIINVHYSGNSASQIGNL